MKVLLLSATPPPAGGVATWTLKYMEYCKNHDIEVNLVNMALQGKRGENITKRINFRDECVRTINILRETRNKMKEMPDIVHLNTSCSQFGVIRDLLIVKLAARKKIPLIYHCHCDVKFMLRKGYQWNILKQILKLASKEFVLNKSSEKVICELGGKNIVVMPNFIEANLISERKYIKDNIETVLYVGHVTREKGCIEIIKTAEQHKDIKFILAGPVSSEIDSLPKPANVKMTGQLPFEEIRKLYQQSDIYLFPSYSEGFSLSLTEAMASGLPVITTDVGANYDMIEQFGGLIVETKNPKAISDAINSLQNKTVRESMSVWNKEKIRNCYVTDKVMKTIIDEYKKVAG